MTDNDSDQSSFEPLKAIGVFLAVFGVATMAGALIDMPTSDKLINLVCGVSILLCGSVAFGLGLMRTRR